MILKILEMTIKLCLH